MFVHGATAGGLFLPFSRFFLCFSLSPLSPLRYVKTLEVAADLGFPIWGLGFDFLVDVGSLWCSNEVCEQGNSGGMFLGRWWNSRQRFSEPVFSCLVFNLRGPPSVTLLVKFCQGGVVVASRLLLLWCLGVADLAPTLKVGSYIKGVRWFSSFSGVRRCSFGSAWNSRARHRCIEMSGAQAPAG